MIAVLTFAAVISLAWANGVNDVSKGVATLVGCRCTTYRSGLRWGTIWTAAGALTALVLSAGLLRTFSPARRDRRHHRRGFERRPDRRAVAAGWHHRAGVDRDSTRIGAVQCAGCVAAALT